MGTDIIRLALPIYPRKKFSTNELELLAVVWSVDLVKHYLLGKEFIIATYHKALTSAFGEKNRTKLINLGSLGGYTDYYDIA